MVIGAITKTPAPPDFNIEVRAASSDMFSNKKIKSRDYPVNVKIRGVRGNPEVLSVHCCFTASPKIMFHRHLGRVFSE